MDTRVRSRLSLLALLAAGALLGAFQLAPAAIAANYRLGKNYGGDFTLTDHEGKAFSLRDARGKVVLIHFGFTSCDSTCPATMTKVSAALEKLGSRAASVQPLLISVDTRRDTPAVLRDYVHKFHPAYVGLTGSKQQVEAVARQYRAPIHVHAADGDGFYVADHGSGLYLVARDGMLADLVFFEASPDVIAKRVASLLDHRTEPKGGSR
ncbi:MAG: SCO family protein [Vicinamibacterales bacterium]